MVDEDGIYHKRYIYDAYGNVSTKAGWGDRLDTPVADLNPFLYNGYYYDTETGFYYCNSRYYDPENSRFFSADDYISTGRDIRSYNMYVYCNNDPIMYIDNTGEFPWVPVIICVAVVCAAIALDHYLAANCDGGGQLIPDNNDNRLTEKPLYAEGTGFKVDQNGMTVVGLEVGAYKGVTEYENAELSLFTILTASAHAEIDWSGAPSAEAKAIATAYKMNGSYTFDLGGIDLTVEGALNVGAVGAGIELDFEEWKFVVIPPMYGIIPQIGWDIDLK